MISGPYFSETGEATVLQASLYVRLERDHKCCLCLLLKEFMATHQKETKYLYLKHEGIMMGIKGPDVNNKSR